MANQRKRKKLLSKEKVVEMREAMDKGMSIQECARRHNVAYFATYQIRRGWSYARAGGPTIQAKVKRISPETAARIVALRGRGATIDQLAKASGFGPTTVKKVIRLAKQAKESDGV